MPNENLTLERAYEIVNDAEQLSLTLITLHNQGINNKDFYATSLPLLEKLNSDLQDASMLILFNKGQMQGGMGEAPMLSALEPLSC